MTALNGGDTTHERIARLETSQAQLANEVSQLAGNVDRFVASSQAGFERLSSAIAQVERSVGGEIARITRPDWQRVGVTLAIVSAVLAAVMAPVLVRQTAIETWSRGVEVRAQNDHEALVQARIDAAVVKDRLERAAAR